ncbi:hypothetical protein JCM14244_16740 [Venenivibrio stagnispumantis]|uniref:Uncharacterized protein n=1 Tax=Venenivibrio stagnispumantis TaxID=407998 RepID=A0AA45WQ41_9AQUI|nr:hypothetical protein [Venenivibrio stagnispumantis]MCW4573548.1 hypothetical protein [Venenivibrio stagnispumantis]SMP23657.1 hypothetical protein SAMN06264868_13010 [Venenivibrio stagnispumantis]
MRKLIIAGIIAGLSFTCNAMEFNIYHSEYEKFKDILIDSKTDEEAIKKLKERYGLKDDLAKEFEDSIYPLCKKAVKADGYFGILNSETSRLILTCEEKLEKLHNLKQETKQWI